MSEKRKSSWASGAQFLASLLGVFVFCGISLGGILLLSLASFEGVIPLPGGQTTSMLLLMSGIGFVGVMLIPSCWYAARDVFDLPGTGEDTWRGAGWLITVYPILLGLGYLAKWNAPGGQFLLAVSHVLANAAAIFWVLHLGRRGLSEGSPQRFWGVFGSGLALAPLLALVSEFLFLILIGVIWYLYLIQHPDLMEQISNLVDRLPQSAASPAILDRVASKYLFNTGILATVFSYIALIIPLVEEIIKPIGVWLLIRRRLSPEEGFALGMLSGAGYALFENLTLSANAEVWVGVMVSRFGTTAVHMLTSGVVGWGLVSLWSEGRNRAGRLAKAFFVSVLLHGVWNGLNILSALVQFSGAHEAFSPFLFWSGVYAPAGIFILAVGSIYGLVWVNRAFKETSQLVDASSAGDHAQK